MMGMFKLMEDPVRVGCGLLPGCWGIIGCSGVGVLLVPSKLQTGLAVADATGTAMRQTDEQASKQASWLAGWLRR